MGPLPAILSVPGASCLHTARVKSFPSGAVEVLCCDRPIFRRSGWEPQEAHRRPCEPKKTQGDTWTPGEDQTGRTEPPAASQANLDRAMRRARAQVRDLALANPFSWFVTLTLDKDRVDRYDMGAITKKLNNWLDNQVRRRGLKYVLVPERHRDGAIHFHGFFNDALEAVDSGTISMPGGGRPRKPRGPKHRQAMLLAGGHPVYNLPGWSLGFTTAIGLYGDYEAAVGYVCKYIGKQGDKPGGRWYYSGGDLQRPQVDYTDAALRDLEGAEGAYRFDIPRAGLSFVMLRWKGMVKDGRKQELGTVGGPVPQGGAGRRAPGLDGGAGPGASGAAGPVAGPGVGAQGGRRPGEAGRPGLSPG